MTPAQQSALEGLVDRALTAQEVADIDPLLAANNRNDVAIAAVLSIGRMHLGSLSKAIFQRWAARTGVRAVIEDHATTSGSPLRSIALTLRDVLWSDIPAIDFALTENQQLLQAWVTASAITQTQADELLGLATSGNPVSVDSVSKALNKAEGRLTFDSFIETGDPS